ncbi:MAG: serine hydrolase [Anaerolineae bacterium]|nr:serine hydrolase [Anaerolineae bacterium]
MVDLEQALQAVESGLLPAIRIAGRPQPPFNLTDRMVRYNVPGFSIALVLGNEIAWTRGHGLLEAGSDKPVTANTLFQAASISKPVSAMAALRLVQDGLLDLDADVNTVLRSWQIPENEHTRAHKVTLRGLLSHTAGLTVSGFRGYPAGQDVPTVRQILDGQPPANSDPVRVFQEPGTAYSYSGGGYTVIQQFLEDVTGQPFADLMQTLVLDKLGMAHSTFQQPLPETLTASAAVAHWGGGQPVPGGWHTYPELAAAGLWTTPSDLARFVIEILKSYAGKSNVVLSAEMTRQMLTPPAGGFYGLGFAIVEAGGRPRFEHFGWNEGYHSFMGGHVDHGQGVVWMANGENGELLGQEVMRGLAQALGWSGFEQLEKAVAQVDPAIYARYEGQYRPADRPDDRVVIVQERGRLFLEEMPDRTFYELIPESDTRFFSCDRPEPVTFITGTGVAVETIRIGEHWRLERMG